MLRVIGDDQVWGGRAADSFLPSGAHEGVAGSLCLGDFDGSDGHGLDDAGARWARTGESELGDLLEEFGCCHGEGGRK